MAELDTGVQAMLQQGLAATRTVESLEDGPTAPPDTDLTTETPPTDTDEAEVVADEQDGAEEAGGAPYPDADTDTEGDTTAEASEDETPTDDEPEDVRGLSRSELVARYTAERNRADGNKRAFDRATDPEANAKTLESFVKMEPELERIMEMLDDSGEEKLRAQTQQRVFEQKFLAEAEQYAVENGVTFNDAKAALWGTEDDHAVRDRLWRQAGVEAAPFVDSITPSLKALARHTARSLAAPLVRREIAAALDSAGLRMHADAVMQMPEADPLVLTDIVKQHGDTGPAVLREYLVKLGKIAAFDHDQRTKSSRDAAAKKRVDDQKKAPRNAKAPVANSPTAAKAPVERGVNEAKVTAKMKELAGLSAEFGRLPQDELRSWALVELSR